MENQSLLEGGRRVKFTATFKGSLDDFFHSKPGLIEKYRETAGKLSVEMAELEACGAAPVCTDEKVGGNGGFVLDDLAEPRIIAVTKSGKSKGCKVDIDKDMCIIESFNKVKWEAVYYAASADVLPTSDTPLHFAALNDSNVFDWSTPTNVCLHGHALETEAAAAKYGLPISTRETLFSTPEDTAALMELWSKYPYPQHKVFIRKGHGFMLLGKDIDDAINTFLVDIKPAIVH